MTPPDAARELETLARDLDLAVFLLERELPTDPEEGRRLRHRLRRELERIRDRAAELGRSLG